METGPTQFEEFAAESRERFARIETRLDQTATKADLHMESAALVKWMVGTAVVLGAAAITVITFVLNYATPPRNPPVPVAQTAAAPAPIIIQIPPYPAPLPR